MVRGRNREQCVKKTDPTDLINPPDQILLLSFFWLAVFIYTIDLSRAQPVSECEHLEEREVGAFANYASGADPMRTAHTLNSGILETVSSLALVSRLAAASA